MPPQFGGTAVVPSGHDAATYAVVRSLAARGVDTIVASEHARVPAAASRFCAATARLPPPREDFVAYRDAVLDLAARDDVATVIPVRPEDCYLLSKYRDAFTDHVSLVVPSMRLLERVQDRVSLADAAAAAGVPVPETRPLSAASLCDSDCIVKSRYNVLAAAYLDGVDDGVVRVEKTLLHVDPDDPPDPATVREQFGHDPIVQEYVRHDGEFVVGALYDHGTPLLTFQHEQVRGTSYTGGGGVYRRSISDPELGAVARDLLSELDYHGLACIEYMRDARTGEYVLTELNPRLWQSLPAAVRAGADFPAAYWLAATGRAHDIETGYDVGLGSHLLHGELGYLASIRSESSPHVAAPSLVAATLGVAASCVRDPHFDYFALDDPGPFLAGVRQALPV